MDNKQRAALADSILQNEAFNLALDDLRADALESLAMANPTSEKTIMALQSDVRVIDDLRGKLKSFVIDGKSRDKNGIV